MTKFNSFNCFFLGILLLVFSSCSYTNKTGTAKHFNKKHYNKNFKASKLKNKPAKVFPVKEELHEIEKQEAQTFTSSINQNEIIASPYSFQNKLKPKEVIEELEVSKLNFKAKQPQVLSDEKEEVKLFNAPSEKNRKRALASIILGAIGLVFGYIGIPIAALVLGNKAMKNSVKGSENHRKGKIGRALGITGLVFRILAIAFLVMAVFILLL